MSGGVTQHRGVEPAGPAAAAGDGAELATDFAEPFAVGAEIFAGERPGADTGAVRLGDADHPTDALRGDAGARTGSAGDRIGTT